jgi:hypothetical protein
MKHVSLILLGIIGVLCNRVGSDALADLEEALAELDEQERKGKQTSAQGYSGRARPNYYYTRHDDDE